MIAELKSQTAILPPLLKPAPNPDYVWDFSKGADFSTLCCTEPDVRIKADKAKGSPGRTIGVQRKNPRRNTLDYRNPLNDTIQRAEGSLEMKGLYQDFRDPQVTKVEPQYGPWSCVDREGKTHHVYWDARISYSNRPPILKDYKPASIAIRKNHAQIVERNFLQMPEWTASEARLITDRDLPAWAVANGRLMHSVLCDGNWVMLQEMAHAASLVADSSTIEEFCLPFGGVGRTFRTAIYLLAKGKLWHRPGLIEANTPIGPIRPGDGSSPKVDAPQSPGPTALALA